jgi:SAM-dependent methyltransferase
MKEPFRTQFRELIRLGAFSQDIHDVPEPLGYAVASRAITNRYIERETDRVETNQKSIVPLLEHFVGTTPMVLDVGCNTGGTTVALSLSRMLRAEQVVGVDPNRTALDAAWVRAAGYDVEPSRLRFEAIRPKEPLPFSDCRFDLTTCVSVLEFVSKQSTRQALAAEMQRVTRPGGYIFIITPCPWKMRELHSRRLFGDFRRRDGYPWSSTPSAIRRMFGGCDRIPVSGFVLRQLLLRKGIPGSRVLCMLSHLVVPWLRWQNHLFRKPAQGNENT